MVQNNDAAESAPQLDAEDPAEPVTGEPTAWSAQDHTEEYVQQGYITEQPVEEGGKVTLWIKRLRCWAYICGIGRQQELSIRISATVSGASCIGGRGIRRRGNEVSLEKDYYDAQVRIATIERLCRQQHEALEIDARWIRGGTREGMGRR